MNHDSTITGYVAIWRGIVCQLPLHPVRGAWYSSCPNQQEVIRGTYKGKPVQYNVIHYTMVGADEA